MSKLKYLLLLIPAYIIFCVGFSYGGGTVPTTVGKPLTQDPTLVADAQQLGVDISQVNITFAKSLNADDIEDDSQTVGLFTSPNSIQVKSGLDKQQELQTVAYEVLHYYWSRLPHDQKLKMSALLQTYYNENSMFREATKYYTGDQSVLDDERNSTACTVVPPYLLTDEFNAYCNQYIPNRSILLP